MSVEEVSVSPQLVAFMKHVVAILDDASEDTTLDYDDAIRLDDGYGGRLEDGRFAFVFFPADRDEKWSLVLDTAAIRAVARKELQSVGVRRAGDVHHRHPDAHVAARPHDATLGARLLDALIAKELVVLAADARRAEIARALEEVLVQALDDRDLDDAERGFEIAEVLGGMHGVEEMLVEDEQLVALARTLDR